MDERPESITIDLSEVSDRGALHDVLARSLDFPAFYGRNWAAFWDAITGLVEMPVRLRLLGWSSLEARLPEEAHSLRACLLDATEQYPKWSAIVEYA